MPVVPCSVIDEHKVPGLIMLRVGALKECRGLLLRVVERMVVARVVNGLEER